MMSSRKTKVVSSTSKWERYLERVRDGKEMLRQGKKISDFRGQRQKRKHLRTAEQKKQGTRRGALRNLTTPPLSPDHITEQSAQPGTSRSGQSALLFFVKSADVEFRSEPEEAVGR